MGDKRFPPSIKRLTKLRRDGNIIKSQLVTQTGMLWVFFFALPITLTWVRNGTLVQWSDGRFYTPFAALAETLRLAFSVIFLLVGGAALTSLGIGLAQTQLLFLPAQLLKGFKRYRPAAWLDRVRENSVAVALGIMRCAVIVVAMIPTIQSLANEVPSASDWLVTNEVDWYSNFIKSVYARGLLALSVIASVTYAISSWRFYRQNRMSAQELRDEYREDEGDPHTKSQRKLEHRTLLFSEVEKRVKRSNVVIVRRCEFES